jgi:hypothetical protein
MRTFILTTSLVIFSCFICPLAKAADFIVGSIVDTEAMGDYNCSFPAPAGQAVKEAPKIVSAQLSCEVWVNVDGKDRKLRSEKSADCEGGWNIPREGSTFVRVYRNDDVSLRATYRVLKTCWIADRCEDVRLQGKFIYSTAGQARTVKLEGICAW